MALLEKQLYIRKSTLPGSGKGLFTKKFIPKGTRIVEYKGEILTWKEVEQLADDRNGYVFYVNSKHCIDAWNYKKALGRFANDAKGLSRIPGIKTNAEYVVDNKRCFIEAIRDIPAKSEIFVEYGAEYWKVVRDNLKIDQEWEKEKKKGKKAKLPHHKATKRM